ncbi:hypothetical protein PG988_015480 [Apiospora saccharicola]
MYYPGPVSDTPWLPSMPALGQRRIRRDTKPIAPMPYTPLPQSTPTSDPGGGAGAPGGNSAGPVGPGRYGKSGGGVAGPMGGFGSLYYNAPMPGNQFKAGWDRFISGPSHVEL